MRETPLLPFIAQLMPNLVGIAFALGIIGCSSFSNRLNCAAAIKVDVRLLAKST
jgi:hypothetical protein